MQMYITITKSFSPHPKKELSSVATTELRTVPVENTPLPRLKKKIGRPRKTPEAEINSDEEETEGDEVESTAPAAQGLETGAMWRGSKEDFWDWVKGWTPEEWQKTTVYLYRVAPKINLRFKGQYAYVTRYFEPFDIETIKQSYGSGGYKLQVSREPSVGPVKTLAIFFIDIMDIKFPPVVPAGAWMDDPANKDWEWARPDIEKGTQAVSSTI